MNKGILSQAFVTMGYRKMKDNVYGKPVGFCLILARIIPEEGSVKFETWFENVQNEPMCWNSADMCVDDNTLKESAFRDKDKVSNKDLYEYFIKTIAYCEIEVNTSKALEITASRKVFAFETMLDIYNYM